MQLDTGISFDGNSFSSNNMTVSLVHDTAMSPSTTPIWVSRAGAWPVLAGKDFQGQVLNLEVTCNGTFNTQLESLVKWFAPSDETPRLLIFKDTAANVQWQVYASCFQISAQDGPNVILSLAVDDPVWQTSTQNSQTWNVTASSSTDITLIGNQPAWPVFEITPTSYPTDGWISNRYVQVYSTSTDAWPARPLELTGGGWNTAALVSSTDNFMQVNTGGPVLSSDTDVIPYDTVTGSIPSAGMGYFDTEQIIWTGKTGTTSGNLTGVTRGAGGTTAATHLDNAVISVSSILADGRDVLVYKNGAMTDYWFGTGANAMNQTATKIWVVADMPEKQTMTLSTAISAVGTPTEIVVVLNTANKATMLAIKTSGRLIIDSEEFTYTARTYTATKIALTVGTRAVRNTTAASHAVNATITILAYDFNIVFNYTLATAPDIDNTNKPIIDLTSTNSSFVYTNFRDIRGKRAGSWEGGILTESSARYSTNRTYTGINDGGDTDPAAIAGMAIFAYQQAGIWKAETASLYWAGRFTDTVSTISMSGEKYQEHLMNQRVAALQGSTDGIAWATITSEAVQVTTDYSTWSNWSYASSDITVPANTNYLRFYFSATVSQLAGNEAKYGATAITVAMTNVPSVTMRSQQTNYNFSGIISNALGETMTILYPLQINSTIYIDTDPDFPTAKVNGKIVNGAIKTSTIRPDWLQAIGPTETFTFTANYYGNFTVVIKWRSRALFK